MKESIYPHVCEDCVRKGVARGIKIFTCKNCGHKKANNYANGLEVCENCAKANNICRICGKSFETGKIVPFYSEELQKAFLKKLDSDIPLTIEEIKELVYEFNGEEISGEKLRWVQVMETIVELQGRYFVIPWYQGLTELQENEFYEQPFEVKKETSIKMVAVEKYTKISSEKGYNFERIIEDEI